MQQVLFRISPDHCFAYLSSLERHELHRSLHNDFVNQSTKIHIFNSLAALTIARSAKSPTQAKEQFLNQTIKFLSSSQRVRMTVEKSMTLVRAHQLFYSGQITKAYNFVMKIYEEIKANNTESHLFVLLTLSLAQFNFLRRNYGRALQFYKKSLQCNKSLPVKARIGMAYSFYYLNKFQMAKAAFQRILHLEPSCVEAIIGLATIADKQQNHIQYFSLLKKGFKLNPNHPLILLHLAENYLFRAEYDKCQETARNGLIHVENVAKFAKCEENIRNDYEQIKGRLHNIIAQAYHAQKMIIKATQEYALANQKCSIGLAQTLCFNQNYIQAFKILQPLFSTKERLLNDSLKLMGHIKSKLVLKSNQISPDYYFLQALKYNRNDFDARIELSNLLIQTNKIQALYQLQQALLISQSLAQSSPRYKPQLLNNIGVLLIQINDTVQAHIMFQRCNEQNNCVERTETSQEKNALNITVKFNIAKCYEAQFLPSKAVLYYKEVINLNKYYFDAYLALAYLYFKSNAIKESIEILQLAEKVYEEVKIKFLKIDRVLTLKAYILFVSGSLSEGKQILRQMGKQKDSYNQLLQLAINYSMIMRKNVQTQVLKKFLRPERDFCMSYCTQDHYNAFGYMVLVIILATDKKISKQQGIQFFNTLNQSVQLPTLIYNMGLFFIKYDDNEASLIYLSKNKSKETEELTALNHLLKRDFKQSLTSVKKNILADPSNLKYRLQLMEVNERKWEKYYQSKQKEKRQIILCLYQLRKCINFHAYFSRVNINDYLKGIDSAQQKQRFKLVALKMKTFCQERRLYVKSYIESFQKTLKQIDMKEREQIQKKRKESDVFDKGQNQLEKMLIQSDQEERNNREKQNKRKKALEMAKLKQIQLNQRWNQMNQEQKHNQGKKKVRKVTEKVPKTKKKREKVRKQQQSQKQRQFSQQSKSYSSEQPLPQKPKRVRQEQINDQPKRKRLKKAFEDSGEQEDSFIKEQKHHVQPKKEQEEDQFDMQKYLA